MKDQIEGGKADNKTDKNFSQAQLFLGTKVEMEHTNDRTIAREIARDHLAEDPEYYSKLGVMESPEFDKLFTKTSEDTLLKLVETLKRLRG